MGKNIYDNRRPKGGRGDCSPPRVTLDSLDAKLNSLGRQLYCIHVDIVKLLRREAPGPGAGGLDEAQENQLAANLRGSSSALKGSVEKNKSKGE